MSEIRGIEKERQNSVESDHVPRIRPVSKHYISISISITKN